MKGLFKRLLCTILGMSLLAGTATLAHAAGNYESCLPVITRAQQNDPFIDSGLDVGIYYYTVPFEGDTYKYGFSYTIGGTWWPQNWGEINEEQTMSLRFSGKVSDGNYPIIAELIASDAKNFKNPIVSKETGFYVDITVLPALQTEDIVFVKNTKPKRVNNKEVYDWTADLGSGYAVGQYTFYDMTDHNLLGTGYVKQDQGNLRFTGTDLPSDTYTIPKENVVLQYSRCTGISADGKTMYMEVTQAQDVATQVTDKPAVNTITANPTSSPVLLDGKTVSLDAYEIADNNYFKIRDLASVLSGTNSQFEVTWDAVNQAIQLTPGVPYTPVGGELTKGNGQSQPAKVSNAKILLNGASLDLKAYEINGNTYFKLRDLGEALGFGVDWDSAQNAILIQTQK